MSDAASMTPQRARGGRARRQREAQRVHAVIAGIERKIPTYELLDEEGLARIEAVADAILQEVGMDFRGDDDALRLWREASADLKGERVRFPAGLLRSVLKTAPSAFVQHARNLERSLRIGGNSVIFAPAYGSPFVQDLAGGRRYGTLADFESFVKLAYAIPWLHHSGGTVCEPVDIPVSKRHLDMVAAHLRFSDKPFMGSVTAEERAEDSIAMARIGFGRDFVDAHHGQHQRQLAARLRRDDVEGASRLRPGKPVRRRRAVHMGGAMGPVTSAGAVAQALAETMVGCALTQLERPGAPVIFGNFLSSTALRSGSPTFGTPEPALGSLVIGQLARRLKLPLRCSGAFTSWKIPDGQAMQESTMSMLAAVQCGANFVQHSAG